MTDDAKIKKYILQVRKEANEDFERYIAVFIKDLSDKLNGIGEMIKSMRRDMADKEKKIATK